MSTSAIIHFLILYRYPLLFLVVAVEGPIATVISGFLSTLGYLNVYTVYAVVVLGDLAGDSFHYALGRWGRTALIERWGHYLGITHERILRLEKHFVDHGGKTLFIGKLTQVIGALVLQAAGAARMPFRKFLWYNLLATMIKSLALLLIGMYFGQAYMEIGHYLDYAALGTVGLIILPIALYVFIPRLTKNS